MSQSPLVILHGWSDSAESFEKLGNYLSQKLNREVSHIKMADWLSMNDEVTYKDLAVAMQREWKAKKIPTKSRSVDVVVHSTGALVLREWLSHYYSPTNNPINHVLMLAPANFGSPLAHKGKAFYGRIIKGWRTSFQTGTHILNGLEIGSPYTWELAEKDLFNGSHWFGKNRIKATVLVGNRGNTGVRAAANEDGGDGTVRISTANLNADKLVIDFSKNAKAPSHKFTGPSKGHQIGFCILDKDNHGSVIMKRPGTPKNSKALDLYEKALSVTSTEWDAWIQELDQIRKPLETKFYKDSSKHTFQNTVVRVIDDIGNPVEDYFVEFYEKDTDKDKSIFGTLFHRKILRHVHKPKIASNYRCMYVDVSLLHQRIDKQKDMLNISVYAEPIIEDDAPSDKVQVGYDEEVGCISLDPEQVKKAFAHNRTLLVEIIVKRELKNAFKLKNLG